MSVVSEAWVGTRRRERRSSPPAGGESLDDVKDRGNEKDADGAGGEHSTDDGRAHDLTSDRTGTAGSPQGDAAKDEREGCHKDGPQAQTRAFERGIDERLAIFVLVPSELHDENG